MSAEYNPDIETQPDTRLRGLVYAALHDQTDIPKRAFRDNQTLFFKGINTDYDGEGTSSVAGKLAFTDGLLKKAVVAVRTKEQTAESVEQSDIIWYVRRTNTEPQVSSPTVKSDFEVKTITRLTTKMNPRIRLLAGIMAAEAIYDIDEEATEWCDLTDHGVESVKSVLNQADKWKNVSILNLLSVYHHLRVV